MALKRGIAAVVTACVLLIGAVSAAGAQQGGTDEAEPEAAEELETMRPKPDLTDLDQVRFLTDSDFPPFNYLDEEGSLTGFNVDLARSICEELVVECDVRSVDWSELLPALENGETDAVVASIRTTEENLSRLDFTDPYYSTPARFVALRANPLKDIRPPALAGKTIGVVSGTAHEAYLKDFFADATIVGFENSSRAREALRQREIELLFGDGIGLTFWLNGTASDNCCEFRGGPYSDSRYFGEGVGIAVRRGNRKLRTILDYALERVRMSGRLEELYLRYFPLSFF